MGFENFSDELKAEFLADCEKAHSHLEAPMAGTIYVPLCVSCVHINMHYGTWDEPECSEYDPIPEQYINPVSIDCPGYERKPNCQKSLLPRIYDE